MEPAEEEKKPRECGVWTPPLNTLGGGGQDHASPLRTYSLPTAWARYSVAARHATGSPETKTCGSTVGSVGGKLVAKHRNAGRGAGLWALAKRGKTD